MQAKYEIQQPGLSARIERESKPPLELPPGFVVAEDAAAVEEESEDGKGRESGEGAEPGVLLPVGAGDGSGGDGRESEPGEEGGCGSVVAAEFGLDLEALSVLEDRATGTAEGELGGRAGGLGKGGEEEWLRGVAEELAVDEDGEGPSCRRGESEESSRERGGCGMKAEAG